MLVGAQARRGSCPSGLRANIIVKQMIHPGVFSSSRRAWLAVGLYTVFLYSTLTLAFEIYVWIFDRLGKTTMSSIMIWMYLPLGLGLLAFVFFRLPRHPKAYLAFALICLVLLCCLKVIAIPAKRFHFLQYGPLTFFVFDAMRFSFRGRYLYLWTLATVVVIGLGDETLQAILPQRFFGLTDIAINSAAGILTLAFIAFVVGEEHYPWGKGKSEIRDLKPETSSPSQIGNIKQDELRKSKP